MKTITELNEIEKLLSDFVPSKDGAFGTNRCIAAAPGYEQQEWAERGTAGGNPVTVFYQFRLLDVMGYNDASELPFDMDHVSRVEVSDETQAE